MAYDLNNFVDLAVAEVRKAGCRSIGLISPLPTRFTDVVAEGDHDWVSFNRRFIECAGEHGLTIREGWIREPIGHNKPEPTGHQYGYEQALALLALKQRPEGIVVFPDTVARGVITALLADHERAASMTLVAHKLKEIPLICPLPARFVINEASAVAKSLLEMAERQFRGEQPNGPVRLPFHLDQNT